MVVLIPFSRHIKHPPEAMVDVRDLHILGTTKWWCTILGGGIIWFVGYHEPQWGRLFTNQNTGMGEWYFHGSFMWCLCICTPSWLPGPWLAPQARFFLGLPLNHVEAFGDGQCWAMFFPLHRLMPALLLVRWHPLQGLRFWKRGLHWSLLC